MRNLRLVHSHSWLEPSSSGSFAADDAVEAGGRPSPSREHGRSAVELQLPAMDPVVEEMLEHVRIIAPLPHVVRARALARARAVIVAALF